MNKEVYIIRHCKAEGQEPEASLTKEGMAQAEKLQVFFQDKEIDRILTSPYKPAIQSIHPLGREKRVALEEDARLEERHLSSEPLTDWLEKLERTYSDKELAYEGGESSRIASERAMSVLEEVLQGEGRIIILVTHGNLMSLILGEFDQSFGFEEWKRLSNPDVYRIKPFSRTVERIWVED
ncbi:histidine phosphatase family protein [Pontibacillus sp. ALD_SL1]|uniref:histidine phosphatase family protein n=1 Tax=Pontibacillus sp. ALD_SL1 TaxID=2777185 RepID=UPI001A963876|nr:histidine phosphatase family protein [Pontibacillus sp. ALD_SL1]QST01236.1 histidine phosphatase family protein [Pontibacillus sp. ALD_SL1]